MSKGNNITFKKKLQDLLPENMKKIYFTEFKILKTDLVTFNEDKIEKYCFIKFKITIDYKKNFHNKINLEIEVDGEQYSNKTSCLYSVTYYILNRNQFKYMQVELYFNEIVINNVSSITKHEIITIHCNTKKIYEKKLFDNVLKFLKNKIDIL